MSRDARLCAMMCATAVVLASAGKAAATARIRPVSEIHGNLVQLSDLFSGLEGGQDCALGPGPGAGSRLVIGGAQLQAIADQFGVVLNAPVGSTNVVLERPGTPLVEADIVHALEVSLTPLGLPAAAAIQLTDWHGTVVDPGSKFEISSPSFDPKTGHLSADIVISYAGLETAHDHVNGSAATLVTVLVADRNILPGDIVRGSDVAEERRPDDEISAAAHIQRSDVVGLEATRPLVKGALIERGALRRPDAVKRGAMVTLRLSANGIVLTAEGTSVDRGAVGDQVRVLNPISGAILSGTITGPDEVAIDPATGPIVASAATQLSLASVGLTRAPGLVLSPPNAFGASP